ncbi:YkgJ family cysteine cluster protein [Acinetobacter bereziniae]|uniref:YkgJ family cysteine cluster protein n=2 Tax=Acinetobacter bereziniae TaxID=106648 RepID=A0A8I1AHE1_ACIBZ|nr:YkgJ family cysteine cluster protein [Acinetobacter bereziniae]MEC8122890.1 YkgJ family cysteine cluster protein [Pseudomonadota bacterium]MBJ9948727.1 YkgJ family cysteine cluster protein [Acinetobacter bereziniae]MCU4415543.1 YkgJ family cysteine cluster protein [Acinetobacter bereziniae]NUF61608.1 YkgJ family cysteine cluster protein [Acinetobacter bereziniae]NUG05811.1 YkgJ family cysteine cluster protein [Acinetobacter bereziniae]
MLSQISAQNACLNCGACCAFFRVSFYWAEGEAMPSDYVEPLTAVYSCMQGTNQKQPRCIALDGVVGQQVSCTMYEQRSSSCKEVQAGDAQCAKARQAHNLIPLIDIDVMTPSNDEDFDQVC